MPEEIKETTDLGTEAKADDAELQALREQKANFDASETANQARVQLADDLGYGSVEAMDEAGLEAIEAQDKITLEQKPTEKTMAKPPEKPVEKPVEKAPEVPPKRSAADQLAMENYLDNQFILYTMNMTPEERAKVDQKEMRKVFNDRRGIILEDAKTTGNVFKSVQALVDLKKGKKEAAADATAEAKALAEAETTATTPTGMVVNEENKDEDTPEAKNKKFADYIAPDDKYVYSGPGS